MQPIRGNIRGEMAGGGGEGGAGEIKVIFDCDVSLWDSFLGCNCCCCPKLRCGGMLCYTWYPHFQYCASVSARL